MGLNGAIDIGGEQVNGRRIVAFRGYRAPARRYDPDFPDEDDTMLTITAPPGTASRRLLLAVVSSGAAVALLHTPGAAASSGSSVPISRMSISSVASAPVSVSLSAPPSAPRGQAALLGVAVTAADTRLAVAGGTVVLDRRDAGTRRWREAARSVTGPRGHIAFSVRIRSSQDFRARALANDFFAPGRSGVLRVQVKR